MTASKRTRWKYEIKTKIEEISYPKTFEPFLDSSLIVAGVLFQILQVNFGDLLFGSEAAHRSACLYALCVSTFALLALGWSVQQIRSAQVKCLDKEDNKIKRQETTKQSQLIFTA